MTDLRTAAKQALTILETLKERGVWGDWDGVTDALKAALTEDAMQKFTDVNQELEAALAEPVEPDPWGAGYEAGYEAGVARRPAQPVQDHFPDATKMVQDADLWSAGYAAGYAAGMEECPAEPVQQGCDHCNHPMYAAIKCRVCGRDTPIIEPEIKGDKESAPCNKSCAPGYCYCECPHGVTDGNCKECYEANAEPVQEPVAGRAFLERILTAMEGVIDVADRKTDEFDALRSCVIDLTLMLHTAPPQRKPEPNSDYERGFVDGMSEQARRSVDKAVNAMTKCKPLAEEEIARLATNDMVKFARAIEQAHGIKENT